MDCSCVSAMAFLPAEGSGMGLEGRLTECGCISLARKMPLFTDRLMEEMKRMDKKRAVHAG